MHEATGRFIQSEMKTAHEFVRNRIEVKLDADQVYEQLIGNPEMLAAFRNAMQYMPHQGLDTNITIHIASEQLGENVTSFNRARVHLHLPPTEKYRQRFIPEGELLVTRESDLHKYFTKQLAVSQAWAELEYVFNAFHLARVGALEMSFLMRWIRELIADCDWKDEPEAFVNRWSIGKVSKKALREVDRDMRLINSHATPDRFPIVTKRVSDICKSGKALFGQYRLLKSVTGEQEAPLITLLNEGALTGMGVDDGLAEQMNDVILNWQVDARNR